MQNKANFQKSQVNVKSFHAADYENKSNWKLGENKPNQTQYKANQSQYKANQSQSKPIQCQNKAKTNPIKPNFKGKKICLGAPKILTITETGANLKPKEN